MTKLRSVLRAVAAVAVALVGCGWPPRASALGVCPAQWYVSYSGTSSWALLNTDPDNLPLSALRFSRSYNDPLDYSRGFLDFDRDGKSDVFSAVPIGDGTYQWRYMSGGQGAWIDLAYDGTAPADLRFGDFNADAYTDVFSVIFDDGLQAYQWRYSSAGTSSWINLAYADFPIDQLRFGDFNGDGFTDVFVADDLGTGVYAWLVSYTLATGSQSFVQINTATTLPEDMQFGDFDADGRTDVFTTVPDSGSGYYWIYSSGGSGAYQTIAAGRPQGVHDLLAAGNFNDASQILFYHGTDLFYTLPMDGGSYQWWATYFSESPFALGNLSLAYSGTPPSDLRFADFNGDGVTDVFMLVPCDRIFGGDFE